MFSYHQEKVSGSAQLSTSEQGCRHFISTMARWIVHNQQKLCV